MHNCAEPVRNNNTDLVHASEETFIIVFVISSSVRESNEASSLIKKLIIWVYVIGPGNTQSLLFSSRYISSLLLLSWYPTLFRHALINSCMKPGSTLHIIFIGRFRFTNNKFSLIVPENNCVSCVTNPIWLRRSSKLISVSSIHIVMKILPREDGTIPLIISLKLFFLNPMDPQMQQFLLF